jgi:hypothetical protein
MQASVPVRMQRAAFSFPGFSEARAMSVLSLIAAAVMCALSLYYGYRGEAFMGRPVGSDFVEFYAAGKILNQGPAADI